MKLRLQIIMMTLISTIGCATSAWKDVARTRISEDEGIVLARVKVIRNGQEFTKGCLIGFNENNKPAVQLDETGLIFKSFKIGTHTLNRIMCQDVSLYHYNFKGVTFTNAGHGAKTYIGDITLIWDFSGGAKGSVLLGGLGAGMEASSTVNDGTMRMKVEDRQQDILGAYHSVAAADGTPKVVKSLVTVGH